jgi:uncharacterized membrane protein (GlpM family)
MLIDIVIRVIVGGAVVSLFAVLGDLLKPKSFAGLFGAAPSIALATILLAIARQGRSYASVEARSMIVGAIAFLVYAVGVALFLFRGKWPVLPVTSISLSIWFTSAFGLWFLFLR